jgi:CPA1 family monovalent cation:H+ antiporter
LRAGLLSAGLILLRLIWTYPGAHVAYFIRRKFLGHRERTPGPRAIFIVGWTGMRGVVALAAAISLPATFPQRDVILFLTFCVIFRNFGPARPDAPGADSPSGRSR